MDLRVTVAAGSCRFRPTKIQYLKTESSTTGTIATKMWLEFSCKRQHHAMSTASLMLVTIATLLALT